MTEGKNSPKAERENVRQMTEPSVSETDSPAEYAALQGDPVRTDGDPKEELSAEPGKSAEGETPAAKGEEKQSPQRGAAVDPSKYAFSWDYRTQYETESKQKKKSRARAGRFYAIAVSAIFVAAIAILIAALLLGNEGTSSESGKISGSGERVVYVNSGGDTEELLAVEAAIARALPSTVSVLASNETLSGVGSGIVFRSDGYIATNYHVVSGKTVIKVRLYGGETYAAEVVGSDASSDLALLKIDAEGLTPMTFGDSDSLLLGETVMAIGTPTGIGYAETVTRGIVSCTSRAIKIYDTSGILDHTLLMVQTDASVNPGNSGGALIDQGGELIGIVASKTVFYESGTTYYADGMGLAIPSGAAKQILEDLVNGREPDRSAFFISAARLGISGKTVAASSDSSVGGVLVTGFSGSDFDASRKLCAEDIILAIDGHTVSSVSELLSLLEDYFPGTSVSLTVLRGKDEMTISVVLGSDKPLQ